MGSIFKRNLGISIFGESHGAGIGAVIDNLPPGIPIDPGALELEMKRRSAAGKQLATPRKEKDQVEILSGFFNGRTTGTPLCGVIRNTNTKSRDYDNISRNARPGHADYSGYLRYDGYNDYRGGGHFSGRLTAPFVFAGAVCKAVLSEIAPNVIVGSRVVSLGKVNDQKHLAPEQYPLLDMDMEFPLYTAELKEKMMREIETAKAEDNSVGGIVEGFITGLPAGIGDPFFDSIESVLSGLLFSIPGIKGVEFGAGFDLAEMTGAEANDAFFMDNQTVKTRTNYNGGLNGGITNGMPVVFRTVIKATPSISRQQETIDLTDRTNAILSVTGRHDPCILLRVFPVIEAAAAICICDFMVKTWRDNSVK